MFKRILLSVALAFIVGINSAHAWEPFPYLAGTYTEKVNGTVVGVWFGVQQYAQPKTYTCGATTIAMQMMWETHKKGGALRYDTMQIYNDVNYEGGPTSGLTTEELKAGIRKRILRYNSNKSYAASIKAEMWEGSASSISGAISNLADSMLNTNSPAMLYGNVKHGTAGGHYYLASGVLNCPKGRCSMDYIGLFINDSVFNSPAWAANNILRQNAIPPRLYVNHKDLESYWSKTGHWNPLFRNNMYLYNSKYYIV